MRNYLLSYPKSGKNRLELLCLLFLTKYIGTDSPLGYFWLKYWCKFSHNGFHNINIPDLPNIQNGDQFPERSTITILQRDPAAILCSMYRWYQKFLPEDKILRQKLEMGLTVDEFVMSPFGIERLALWGQSIKAVADKLDPRTYRLNFIKYEDSFTEAFIRVEIPRILNLDYALTPEESQWVIDHSSAGYVKQLVRMQKLPKGITLDIVAGLKIGMNGGHIQVGDPAGHEGQLQPETEQIIREAMKGTIL